MLLPKGLALLRKRSVTDSAAPIIGTAISPRSCGARASAAMSCVRNATTGDTGGFRAIKRR